MRRTREKHCRVVLFIFITSGMEKLWQKWQNPAFLFHSSSAMVGRGGWCHRSDIIRMKKKYGRSICSRFVFSCASSSSGNASFSLSVFSCFHRSRVSIERVVVPAFYARTEECCYSGFATGRIHSGTDIHVSVYVLALTSRAQPNRCGNFIRNYCHEYPIRNDWSAMRIYWARDIRNLVLKERIQSKGHHCIYLFHIYVSTCCLLLFFI